MKINIITVFALKKIKKKKKKIEATVRLAGMIQAHGKKMS